MVFNETTNYDFIYLASKAAPSWYIQLNMFLKISGEIAQLLLPLIAGSACKTCQHHLLETRAANVWDLVQNDQQNLATHTGQLSRPVC